MQKEHKYPELIHKHAKFIESKESIAKMLNKFFISPNLAKHINFDENEVIRVVEICKTKSSADAEGVSVNSIKHIIT